MNTKKQVLVNFLLLVTSCLIFFIAAELGFKIIHFFSDPEVSPSSIEGLPYENTANGWFLRYAPVNGWIFYKNNSLGMRDISRTFYKAKGVQRILCLGDSLMYGGEVSFPGMFTRQLEVGLKKYFKNVEVLNCGTTSYSLREYLIYLEKKGLKFNPDVVIIGLCLNDYEVSSHKNAPGHNVQKGASRIMIKNRRQSMEKIKRFLFHSYFLEYLKDSLVLIMPYKRQKIKRDYDTAKDPNSWIGTEDYFAKIKAVCDKNKMKLLIVVFPTADQIVNYSVAEEPQQFIRSVMGKLDIDYVDLLKVYSDHLSGGERVFSRFDGVHPLPLGHKIAADAVEEKIIEDNLLNKSQ